MVCGCCLYASIASPQTPQRLLVVPFENLSREGPPAAPPASQSYWLSEASAVVLTDDLIALGAPAMWTPLSMHAVVQPQITWHGQRRGLFIFPFARLKPGVTVTDSGCNVT